MSCTTSTMFENACRTCMEEGNYGTNYNYGQESEMKVRKNISIFNEPECIATKNVTIMELLVLTTPQLNIETGDMLPKILCENCLERLINAHEFQQMCIRVEQKFRKMVMNEMDEPLIVNEAIVDEHEDGKIKTENGQWLKDFGQMIKDEMNEPLLDNDVSGFGNAGIVDQHEDVKLETECNQWHNSSEEFVNDDRSDKNSEWELQSVVTSKKSFKTSVKILKDVVDSNHAMNGLEVVNKIDAKSSETCLERSKTKHERCVSDLGAHQTKHKKTKAHVCDFCGADFKKASALTGHKMYHTGEKKHKCDYCDMRFILGDACRRHMRTHTGEKPYKCKYCEKAFAQSNDLIKHLRVHLGDNESKCNLCPQGFGLKCDLRAHFNTLMKFGLMECT